jgi:predicted oxidoreductase
VVNLDAVLLHHLLELAVADWVRQIPADRPQDHVPLKMTALELDHDLLAR